VVYFTLVIFMTKLYMVRHCEAIGNQKRLFQGISDFDITDLGEKQLGFLAERFKDIQLDKIYTSPLLRTRKTAAAIKGGRNIEIIPDKGLIEISGGFLEGLPYRETFKSMPGLADTWDNHPEDFAPEGGEPIRNAYERIWDTVCKIAKENKGKTVACSTHGGVIRCLVCRLLKDDIRELKNIPWSDNTSVMLIEFDDFSNVELKYYNDTSHLPAKLIPKRSRLANVNAEDKK
jgi:broad specificity phosphatase PhoE